VRSLWSDAADDAFASASTGQVSRWNGAAWIDTASPAIQLDGVFGTAFDNLFAFGNAGAFRFNGTAWTPTPITPGPIRTAAGASPTTIYAVRQGTPNELLHWNGASFDVITTQALAIHEIAVVGLDDVYATSDNAILHWNGTAWTVEDTTPVDPRQIAATAFDDVVAASSSEILHFDGTRWSPIRSPIADPSNSLTNLAANPVRIDIVFTRNVRAVLRVRPWVCRATETRCGDHFDEDCDGRIDGLDTDCP
jgi:hypothetical protein